MILSLRPVVRLPLLIAGVACGGLAGLGPPRAGAAEGPGFPNRSYAPEAAGTVLALSDPGKALSAVVLHRGWLFVPMGADHGGGQGAGSFALYDVSDPADPTIVFDSRDHPETYHTPGTTDYVGDFAEIHHLPTSGDLLMISERRPGGAGYAILDLGPFHDDDPATGPAIVERFSFPGVTSPTNYDGYSFALAWQGRKILWAPTGANGLFAIDTSVRGAPQVIAHLPRSALANLTLRAAVPIGNLLILSSAAEASTFDALVLDISDPANPRQVGSFRGPTGYQGFVYGSAFYGAGRPLAAFDFADPARIVETTLVEAPDLDRPEYGFGKDGHLFIGHYPGLSKWRLDAGGGSATFVGAVDTGIVDDHGLMRPLGNLIVLTSDHGNDRKLVIGIHDHEKDVTPPAVLFTSPADGETNVGRRSRVGLALSDFPDGASVTPAAVFLREFAHAAPVPATTSHLLGVVNVAPDDDLEPDTTYELVLAAGGLRDQSGNPIAAETVVARFSTGADLDSYTVAVEPGPPAVAGAGVTVEISVEKRAGLVLEHAWDFGDGAPPGPFGPATSASHVYGTPGNHVVTVRTRIAGRTATTMATGVQVVHGPLTAAAPVNGSTLVVDPAFGRVWNANPDNDTVSALDLATYAKVLEVAVGAQPRSVALGPGGTLWVANKGDATLTVLDRATGAAVAVHPLPRASEPHAVVVDPGPGGAAYVSLEATGQVARIDPATGAVTGLVDVGPWPRHLALDAARGRLWVARFISPDAGGRLAAVDLATFTVAGVAGLAPVLAPDSLFNGRGLPNYLGALAISPDGTQAIVPAKKDNVFRGRQRDGEPLTFEFTVRSLAARLDLAAGVESPSNWRDLDNSDFATAAAFSPYGNLVFLATSGSRKVWVVDAYDPAHAFGFDAGGIAPGGLALTPDGRRLFVHNLLSRSVTVFDAAAATAGTAGALPELARVPVVAAEKLPPVVLRGKQLFHDSADPRLSQDSYMSCASCHADGGHDGRVWDFTSLGEGLRSTPDLRGRGLGHGPEHWTGNFDEVQDFEGQVRQLGGGTGLMAAADFHFGTRSHPLGLAKAGVSADLDALAAYVRSLTAAGSSPHRAPDGSLTGEALAGRAIFVREGCQACHGGPAFTDSASFARHDVGTLGPGSGSRLGGPLDGLDTPTLRGLWRGAPYLHDGSAATLHDVLVTRNGAGRHGSLFHLTEAERGALEAYLLQIDDAEPAAPQPGPNGPPVLANPGPQAGLLHRPAALDPVAADPDGDALVWSAAGLPAGLAIDPATGAIRGTPLAAGTATVTLGVRDGHGHAASVTFGWDVADTALDLAQLGQPAGPFRYLRLVALSAVSGYPWTTLAELDVVDATGTPLDRTGWTAAADLEETVGEDGRAAKVLDGDPLTFWHTTWTTPDPDPGHPHELTIDMAAPRLLGGVVCLPRQGVQNGRIVEYELYGRDDGAAWVLLSRGAFPEREFAAQTIPLTAATGGVTHEWWTGLPGTAVADLRSHPAYPLAPDGSALRAGFAAPAGFGEAYGARLHGFLVPPRTGDYVFWIAAADAAELWLSTNESPSSARLLAHVDAAVPPEAWEVAPATQRSPPVPLVAGRLYHIEARHKAGAGDDHLAVAWQGPSLPRTVIEPFHLAPIGTTEIRRWPEFAAPAYAFATAENAPAGTVLGQVAAADADPGQAVAYAIASGNTGGQFAIDPASGVLRLAAPLDFEAQAAHALLVAAADDGAPPLSTVVPVTVAVTNVLETNAEVVFHELAGPGGPYAGSGNPFLVGFGVDPEGDARPNVFEALLGSRADRPDGASAFRFDTVVEAGRTYVVYEYDVDVAADGRIAYEVRVSGDLTSWRALAGPPVPVGEAGGRRTYRLRDDTALEDSPHRFVTFAAEPDWSP